MPLIRPGIRRLFSLGKRRGASRQAEVDDEVALHLALREEQLLAAGFSSENARIEAMRRFGSTITAREDLRAAARNRDTAMHLREQWEFLAQDTRYALRGLLRERWFTAFVAITLGLGIGVNGAMYGVVDRLLLRGPLYVRDADGLQNVYVAKQADGMAPDTTKYFGYVTYTTLRDHASRMRVATFKQTPGGTLYGSGPDAQRWSTADATPGLFPLLGASPLLGRFFTEDEDRPSPSQFVVVLGYNVWKREFNSDPAIVGKSITLSDKSYTIIGVARKGFTGPQLAPVDVWFPSMVRGSAGSNTWATNWNW